jgi:HEAT repeat protein
VIVKAQYGKLPEGPLADVTKRVADMVKSGARAVEASNGNFGDPANGIQKQLRVDYTVNGVTISKTVVEQESLAFTAAAAPPAVIETIARALDQSQREAKAALVRSLRSAGGPAALQRVKAAMTDQDPAVKNAALRAVCDWPTPDALPMVAELVKSPPSKTVKVLALRGFVRLVPQQDATGAQKQADRDEEKRLVLSALGNVPTVEALALVASHLENPALKEEASLAAVAIAEKIVSGNKAEVGAAMQKVAKATGNQKLAARAKALARQAKP